MIKISCIIPSYNEGPRIKRVLSVASKHPKISEVIVINDGSTDDTLEQIKQIHNITIIDYKKNKGKSYALMMGIKKAKNNFIMILDSDLVGLEKNDLTKLILPITKGKADVTISLRKNSLNIYKFFNLDFVSGERVFNKNILGDIKKIGKLKGFGFESYLNKKIIENRLRIQSVYWPNTISPRKSTKMGFFRGALGDLNMIKEIIQTIGLINILVVFVRMKKLMIN